jgi:hypothetical protein
MPRMETVRILNAIGIILVVVGILASAVGIVAPAAAGPGHRYNRMLTTGLIFVVLGGGMLLVVYLTGLLV